MVCVCKTLIFLIWLLIFTFFSERVRSELYDITQIEHLARQWAPLLWLSPDEKFMPLNVQEFLDNVNVADSKGSVIANARNVKSFTYFNSKTVFLVPKLNIDFLKSNKSSFIYGKNPKTHSVSVYAVVTQCGHQQQYPPESHSKKSYEQNTIEDEEYYSSFINRNKHERSLPKFHVTYWTFYPYNEGKEVCFLGKVPTPTLFTEKCFGHLKRMGNHVGDWEHTSIFFNGKSYPERLFLSVHDAGAYYFYDPKIKVFKFESKLPRKGVAQVPKFPPFVRVQGGHPVLFSARGSHGLWSSPGDHEFIRVPKIIDKNGFGTPWKTWQSVEFYHHGISVIPHWMRFKGKWGAPKSKCLLLKRLGLCEYTEGPMGLMRDIQDFYC